MSDIHRYTPKRALLQARWQRLTSFPGHVVAELLPEAEIVSDRYAAVDALGIYKAPGDEVGAGFVGREPSFEHRLSAGPTAIVFSGWLACHVIWPFSESSANVLIPVWERNEEFRVIRVPTERIRVARAEIDFISPTEDERAFVAARARTQLDHPRTDTF